MSHYEKGGGGTIVKYRLCPLQASSSLFLYSSMFLLTYLSLLLFFSLTPFSFIYVLDLALALYLPTVFPPCLFHFFSFLSQFLPQVNSLSASLKKVTFASSTPSPSSNGSTVEVSNFKRNTQFFLLLQICFFIQTENMECSSYINVIQNLYKQFIDGKFN